MRIRATVAAVSGALALSALAVPAAQAADTPKVPASIAAASQVAHSLGGTTTFASSVSGTPYELDASFSNVKVNNAKNVVVGTTAVVKVPVSFTLNHAADVDIYADDFFGGIEIYRGTDYVNAIWWFDSGDATCSDPSGTSASCTATIAVDPAELLNEDAGSWKAAGFAVAFNDEDLENPNLDNVGVAITDKTNSLKVQRLSKLTVNASPEPVKKGKTITVTGKLTRADWNNTKYAGLPAGQAVKLQFRKKGSSTYTTVKTIKTTTGGALKTTVKAASDGYWRYAYAGITSTAPSTATGDYVDVK
ncbi:hypothetical protein ACIPSE_37000 [Streptomyces sp. NPDC090106]|uniref:hypothetical protein n=1 Tax=Streptomyces sp. NPDC090106 TaxID=3365946 RepID=UPI00382B07D9